MKRSTEQSRAQRDPSVPGIPRCGSRAPASSPAASRTARRLEVLGLTVAAVAMAGCAEGPLWRTGHLSRSVTERWQREEQIANSVFERKRQMALVADQGRQSSGDGMNRAARELAQIAVQDPVLLNRMEAIRQLGRLDCPVAWDALRRAAADPDPQVRLVVVQSWQRMSSAQAVPALSAIFGSDASPDVRLAAVRAMGEFTGEATVIALEPALHNADPAIQLRATESLARVTGEQLGPDVQAWSRYVAQTAARGRETTAQGNLPPGAGPIR